MKLQLLSVLTFFTTVPGLQALTKVEINPEKAIEIQISHEDVNRFSVEDGEIVDFIGDKRKIHSTLHPATGAAFIYVSK